MHKAPEIRCLLVDDEPLALALLRDYIQRTEDLVCVESISDPLKALSYLGRHPVDLLFLDIRMPQLSGLQLMQVLRGKCPVILTTAYPEYALDGYEHDVIDYLLKPIPFERFLVAVEKARKRLGTSPLPEQAQGESADFFFVRSEYKKIRLSYDEVLYLESVRDYIVIHTPTKKILTLQRLSSFEESLPADRFMRVHKSFIVHIHKIDALERKRILIGSRYIPLGETYEKEWKRRFEP